MTFSKKSGAFPPELARRNEDDGRTILGQELRAIIEDNGFRPHPEKTWLFNRQGRQVVTGLVAMPVDNQNYCLAKGFGRLR